LNVKSGDLLFFYLHLLTVYVSLPLSLFLVSLFPPCQVPLLLFDTTTDTDLELLLLHQFIDVVCVVRLHGQQRALIKEAFFLNTFERLQERHLLLRCSERLNLHRLGLHETLIA
jgi:hypothetical protein